MTIFKSKSGTHIDLSVIVAITDPHVGFIYGWGDNAYYFDVRCALMEKPIAMVGGTDQEVDEWHEELVTAWKNYKARI